jgi:hypothetical protein
VTARQFPDLGIAATKEIDELEPVQRSVRTAQAAELVARVPGVSQQSSPPEHAARPAVPDGNADDVPDAA